MSADRLPPGAAALIARIEAGELTEGDRKTLARAMRAAVEGRPIVGIVNAESREQRDDALRAMAAVHFADQAPSRTAKEMAIHLARYAASTFPADRAAASPPRAGTLRRAAFEVLRESEPPRWRTILAVLQRYPVAAANDLTAKPSPEAP